ncbi:MAG: SRPBCC domain-containing protein, partial [Xanthomonadales bacterium]|nr:SRPBCC domain-containing protein [Xanthomonadales bacterium]
MTAKPSLTMTRTFPTAVERLYALWTREELLKTWFCPGEDMTIPVAETDPKEGGRYRIVMQDKDGQTYSPSGVYETVIPNKKLVFSWKWADSEVITRVTLEFRALGDNQSELTLIHDGFPDASMRDRHNEGW